MSLICQTFVQNTWRKDLCSNCFKSKDEHGGGGGGRLGGRSLSLGGSGEGILGGGPLTEANENGERYYTSAGRNGIDGGLNVGSRGGSKRYVGVAERVYRRGYYPQNSWKSLVIDKSDSSPVEIPSSTSTSSLTSPGLIRGMSSSLVSHENEKNLKLSDLGTSADLLRSSRLVREVRTFSDSSTVPTSTYTPQSQARILTQLLGDKDEDREDEDRPDRLEDRRSEEKEEFESGDVSSDLGSEASHDSSNSNMSSPSSITSYKISYSEPNSDTSSIKSDKEEEQGKEDDKKQAQEDRIAEQIQVTPVKEAPVDPHIPSPCTSPPPPPPSSHPPPPSTQPTPPTTPPTSPSTHTPIPSTHPIPPPTNPPPRSIHTINFPPSPTNPPHSSTQPPRPSTHTPTSSTQSPRASTQPPGPSTRTPTSSTQPPRPSTRTSPSTTQPPASTHTPPSIKPPASTRTSPSSTQPPALAHTPPSTKPPASTRTSPSSTQPPASTHTPPSTKPPASTHTPPSTKPPASTHTPPSTKPPTSTYTSQSIKPPASTHTPPSTKPPTSTHTPQSTKPAVTHTPPSTKPPTSTHTPQYTKPPASTHTPPSTKPPTSTHNPQSAKPPVSTHVPHSPPTSPSSPPLLSAAPQSILKKPSERIKKSPKSKVPSRARCKLTFNSRLEEVIGYGGDVDYSDDEDEYSDDDDDDYDDPAGLTPDERLLRKLTMKNTDFNSDNDNLKKDIPEDEILPSVEELEAKRKIIIAEIEELERLGRENRMRNERAKKEQEEKELEKTQQPEKPTDASKQEGKVKLKRSPPLVSTKPLIARTSSSEPRVNQVLPMKNGEVVRPGEVGGRLGGILEAVGKTGGKSDAGEKPGSILEEEEQVPLKGIKPKYVSREEEMVEKVDVVEELKKAVVIKGKVTSIDDVCKEKVTSIDNDYNEKVSSLDNECQKKVTKIDNISKQKIISIDDVCKKKVSSVDDVCKQVATVNEASKQIFTSLDISKNKTYPAVDTNKQNIISKVDHSPQNNKNQDKLMNGDLPKKELIQTAKLTNEPTKPQSSTPLANKPSQNTNETTVKSKPELKNPSTCKPLPISAPRMSLTNGTSSQRSEKSEKSLHEDSNAKLAVLVGSKSSSGTPSSGNRQGKQGSESSGSNVAKLRPDTPSSPQTGQTKTQTAVKAADTSPLKTEDGQDTNKSTLSSKISSSISKAVVTTTSEKTRTTTTGKQTNAPVSTTTTAPTPCKQISPATTASNKQTSPTTSTSNKQTSPVITTTPSKQTPPAILPTTTTTIPASTTTTPATSTIPITQSSTTDPRRRLSNVSSQDVMSLVGGGQSEVTKTPASRQGSNSSLMSTFGTPVIIATHSSASVMAPPASSASSSSFQQNSSFLHSSPARGMYDEVYSCPSNVMVPNTTDFLREIRAPSDVQTPTAGIQKSALYASTSCLKGLPGTKPFITPKPPTLKDKPKLPLKPPPNSSKIIYATPAPVTPKVPIGSLSISSPNLVGLVGEVKEDSASSSSSLSSTTPASSEEGRKLPPPTTQAPALPKSEGNADQEAVYDIPVTLSSPVSSASSHLSSSTLSPMSSHSPTSPTFTSTTYSTSPKLSTSSPTTKNSDDATIYHEIDDSIKTSSTMSVLSAVTRNESTRCQPRSTFEANRSLLSAALDLRAAKLSPGKRMASDPPEEEEEEEVTGEEETQAITEPPATTLGASSSANLPSITPSQDSQGTDGESYSSFTDDFDDDEDEENLEGGTRSQEDMVAALRKSERSCSAVPLYRNSIGPIPSHHEVQGTTHTTFHPSATAPTLSNSPTSTFTPTVVVLCPGGGIGSPPPPSNTEVIAGHPQVATRSHSVPRCSEYMVNVPSEAGDRSSGGGLGSKFGFGRSGFFRPSSPPTVKRGSSTSSERGRDRKAKKTPSSSSSSSSSSKFSLKKLLRLGGGGKEEEPRKKEGKKGKEEEKRLARETRKGRLTIIHPIDFNQNGVEVIARPEKTSPIYDYTGIYGYVPPPRNHTDPLAPSPTPLISGVDASPAPSQGSRGSGEARRTGTREDRDNNGYATPSIHPVPVSTHPTSTTPTPSVTNPSPVPPAMFPAPPPAPAPAPIAGVEKNNSFLRRDGASVERRESAASHSSRGSANNNINNSTHHLGYNSEGRPRPPPPPRKASLENTQSSDGSSPLPSPSPCDLPPARPPQRPPPPTRTPSTSGTRSGPPRPEPPRPDPPRPSRDSVYANLGDVRAPITPRKPGRTASIRGEDDREKRRAPLPPQVLQQVVQEVAQLAARQQQQQQQQEEEQQGGEQEGGRSAKGPAPHRPHHQQDGPSSPDTTTKASNRVRRVSSGVRRSSVVSGSGAHPRTLRDQYGAVISANMDALANFLDQLSTTPHQPEFEGLSRWNEIRVDSEEPQSGAGQRTFYRGRVRSRRVTLMITPEPKVDAHHLLAPLPLAAFKDDLPTHLLSSRCLTRGKTTQGTVWVLPPLNLVSLEQLGEEMSSNDHHSSGSTAAWVVLLQLVTGLKQLQARGVEETRPSLTLVARGGGRAGGAGEADAAPPLDPHPTLIITPPSDSDGDVMSLCQCATAATTLLLGEDTGSGDDSSLPHPAPLLLHLLHQERSGSLTQVKRVLEVLLFGPDSWPEECSEWDQEDGGDPQGAEEAALERWLDLERAKLLHDLTRGPPASRVLTKFHLLFLVRANPRVLRETLALMSQPEVTEF